MRRPRRPLPAVPFAAAVLAAAVLSACTTSRDSAPKRTASEQLLISAAADRAARNLSIAIPEGTKVFIDASFFEGLDSKYAIAAIRDRVLKRGARLAASKEEADMIVEIRSGALSIDENKLVVGVPEMDMPVPLAGSFGLPEISVFTRARRQGVAKFAATGYDARTGKLVASSASDFGLSEQTEWTVLFFLSWTTSDVGPDNTVEVLRPPPAQGSPGKK